MRHVLAGLCQAISSSSSCISSSTSLIACELFYAVHGGHGPFFSFCISLGPFTGLRSVAVRGATGKASIPLIVPENCGSFRCGSLLFSGTLSPASDIWSSSTRSRQNASSISVRVWGEKGAELARYIIRRERGEERRGKQFLTVGCLLLSSLATNNISIRWLNRLRRWRHRGNPTREWSSMCAFLHSRACSPLVHCVTLSTVACNVTRSGTNVTEERKRRRTVCLCQCRSVRCRAWQRRW